MLASGSLLCACLLVVAASLPSNVDADLIVHHVDPDVSRLREQVISSLLLPSDAAGLATLRALDAEVPVLVSTLNSTGLWPDVTYADPSDLSAWSAAEHLRRCLMLGIAFASNASSHAGAADVGAAVQACTWGWVAADPANHNWWWQQLGTPQCIAKLLLLSPNSTTAAAAHAHIFARLAFPADVAAFTGANRVWSALVSVLIGLVDGNATRVDAAFALMHAAYAPAVGVDGLQVDGGFHQHGPLAQMSSAYGAHFIVNALSAELAARGTRWAMAPPAWAAVSAYLLDGARAVTRGSEFLPTVCGRHNTYFAEVDAAGVPRGHYHSFAAFAAFSAAFPAFAPLGTASALSVSYARLLPAFAGYPRGSEVAAFAAQVAAGDGSGGWVGHARFWRTDVTAHARGGFAFVLHSFSNRTLNTECVNGEGVQNRALGDGALTVHVHGREYRDVAPAWRWSLVPGTTELQGVAPYTCSGAQLADAAQRAPFVGGAGDGAWGVACHDARREDDGATLVARKAYAFYDDSAVALGAGVVATAGARAFNVTTAIEQRALAGTVYVGLLSDAATPRALPNGTLTEAAELSWVWHDGVTYGLLAPSEPAARGATVGVSTRTQVGAWSAIVDGAPNATVAVPMFLAYVHHGPAPAAAPGAYAYAVLPGSSTPSAGAAAFLAFQRATTIVANTPALHAVCRAAPNASIAWVLHAVLWPSDQGAPAPVPAAAPCPAVSVSHAALVVIASGGGALTVTVSNPLIEGRLPMLFVTIEGVDAVGDACAPVAGGTRVSVLLPLDPATEGSSVTVTCKLQQSESLMAEFHRDVSTSVQR